MKWCLGFLAAVGMLRSAQRSVRMSMYSSSSCLSNNDDLDDGIDVPYADLAVSARLSALAYLNDIDRESGSEGVYAIEEKDEGDAHKARNISRDSSLMSLRRLGPLRFFDARPQSSGSSDDTDFHDTQAYGWLNPSARTLYLFFRGTECRQDMLANLDVRRRTLGCECGALVHRGFRQQLNAIEPDLTKFVQEHREAYDQIVCCGHSLGGALAALAAVLYTDPDMYRSQQIDDEDTEERAIVTASASTNDHLLPPIVHCHTFGSPRVGNEAFAKFFGERVALTHHWRVFDFEDPVAMIPLSCRFVHARGNGLCLVREGRGGGTRVRRVRRDTSWLWRPLSSFIAVRLLDPFRAHEMLRYLRIMEEQLFIRRSVLDRTLLQRFSVQTSDTCSLTYSANNNNSSS
jgi:hypothetical protein